MERGILAFLQGADRTLAWAAAVALAAGGTALFVAFYLQWQRWRAAAARRRDARRTAAAAKAAAKAAAQRPTAKSQGPQAKSAGKPAPVAPRTPAPATGVAAYRRQTEAPAAAAADLVAALRDGATPAPPPAPAPRLDPLLARLQDAGDRLEEMMRRHAHRSHEQDDLARLAAAIDVEFVHKQA
ncbi:MAG: hypothetical protein Q7W29_02310 [bacterium]|nr:hypothetical protein [bacterium]